MPDNKGASIKYVRRFSGFFDPLPPLVRFSRNLSVNIIRIFSGFLDPPLPLGAYVLNGCSLMQSPLNAELIEKESFLPTRVARLDEIVLRVTC